MCWMGLYKETSPNPRRICCRAQWVWYELMCDLQGMCPPDRISFVTAQGVKLRMDEELFITYGDKSNEELLFLYGEVLGFPVSCQASWCMLWSMSCVRPFWSRVRDACGCAGFALENNASDMLMVKCPLPPVEQWDELIRARLLFLLDQGLSPQLFLPASSLPADADSQVRTVVCLTAGHPTLRGDST